MNDFFTIVRLCEVVSVISVSIPIASRFPDNCKKCFAAKIAHVETAFRSDAVFDSICFCHFLHRKFSKLFHTLTCE
jgi:hypothetical protein